MYTLKTPGDKIHELRKKYKIKQHEISGEKVTRNLVSLIENNKASLTSQVAEIIADNFNKFFEQHDIDQRVTISYLMESTGSQANKILDSFIERIHKENFSKFEGFESELLQIEKVIKEQDQTLDIASFYLNVSKVYERNNDFQSQYVYLLRAYNSMTLHLDDIEVANVLLKLCSCAIKINRCEEALKHSQFTRTCFIELPSDLDLKLEFNTALAHKKLGQYEKALNSLNNILENHTQLETFRYVHILTLKANCLQLMDYHTDAIKIHKELFQLIENDDTESLLVAHCNLIEIYQTLGDTQSLEKEVDEALIILENTDFQSYDSNQYFHIMNDIACGLYKLNRIQESVKYYSTILHEAKQNGNTQVVETSMTGLFHAYHKSNAGEKIYELKTELMELIKFHRITNHERLIFKIIGYFTDSSDSHAVMDLVNLMIYSDDD